MLATIAATLWKQVHTFAHARSLKTWPALGGLLLIAPGMLTIGAFASPGATAHVSGLDLDVAYAPTVHLRQPTMLTLSTMSVFGTKGHFSIRIGQKLLQNFSISHITPESFTSYTDGGETIYTFSSGGKDAVTITLIPNVLGRTAGTLQYGLDPPVPFSITTAP